MRPSGLGLGGSVWGSETCSAVGIASLEGSGLVGRVSEWNAGLGLGSILRNELCSAFLVAFLGDVAFLRSLGDMVMSARETGRQERSISPPTPSPARRASVADWGQDRP